jgi:hypothetical protein
MSTTTVTLDTGQFNLLISGLSLARGASREPNFKTRELIGNPEEYSALSDGIVAQIEGEGPAPLAARARIAVREGRAVPIRAWSRGAELCVGELYRDGDGNEVWRIKEVETGKVLREGIASDSDYRWLLDCFNRGEVFADEQEALTDAAALGIMP